MRTDTTILAQLDRQFQWMHAYRRRLLGELTLTLVRKGRGWLTALGRDLDSSTCAKHRIKRECRKSRIATQFERGKIHQKIHHAILEGTRCSLWFVVGLPSVSP
jgi:hypothetical protein